MHNKKAGTTYDLTEQAYQRTMQDKELKQHIRLVGLVDKDGNVETNNLEDFIETTQSVTLTTHGKEKPNSETTDKQTAEVGSEVNGSNDTDKSDKLEPKSKQTKSVGDHISNVLGIGKSKTNSNKPGGNKG